MSISNYILLANLYLIVFFVFYKLLLDKETYFKLNRIYLLCAGILSMALPFCRTSWLYNETISTNVQTMISFETMIQPAGILADSEINFSFTDGLVVIYLIGILFFLGKLTFNLISIQKILSQAVPGAAYSFLGRKDIDSALPSADIISLHEDVHIKQKHSIDVILFEVLTVLNWFNPFIHLYKKSIQDIHEFLADEESANHHGDKHAYAVLIVSNVLGVEPSVLMHGFFKKSLIKKRIYMLHKDKSNRTALLKYGMFLPLFTLAAILSSATLNKNKIIANLADKVDLEKSIEVVNSVLPKAMKVEGLNKTSEENSAFSTAVVKTTDAPIGWTAFYNFISQHINYPSEAYKNNIAGKSQISFNLKNGKVSNLSVATGLGYGCDEEVMKVILSYKDFDKNDDGKYALVTYFSLDGSSNEVINKDIKPLDGFKDLKTVVIVANKKRDKITDSTKSATITVYKKGEPAGVSLNEVVVVGQPSGLKGDVSEIRITNSEAQDKVFDFVSIEKQPEFPGGMDKFYKYLSNSIKYPKEAADAKVQGKVYMQFVVEKDGSITDIQVQRGPGSGTNEEAVRVMKASPKWNPGIQNGKPVRVRYNIAVNFSLTDGKPKPLYILDGKVYDKTLDSIDQNTIESVDVLKDEAATALYGDKGKNGVIIVTTKKKALEKKD